MDELLQPPPLERVLMHLGPIQALCILGMIGVFVLAAVRPFSTREQPFVIVAPLLFGIAATLRSISEVRPLFRPDIIVAASIGESFEVVLLHCVTEIQILLTSGLLFSSLTVLAILFRHRRKAPANPLL